MKFKISFLLLILLTGIGTTVFAMDSSIDLGIYQCSETMEKVTVTLKEAVAVKKTGPDRYEYSFSGTIENGSDAGIMEVVYTFTLYDEDGKEFRSFGEVYDGQDEAIPPHTKIEFSHDGIKWGAQSVPASVSIGISSVKTETELPPVRLPQKGDYLFRALDDENLSDIRENPPVELSFHIDQGGYGQTASFEKGELLDRAIDLFCDIKIGDETKEWVTDNYNSIRITWEDGSESHISLNQYCLEYYAHSIPHVFELENLDDFWSFAEDYLMEDE